MHKKILATLLISAAVLSQATIATTAKADSSQSQITSGERVKPSKVTVNDGKYVIPVKEGIEYRIDNVVVSPGAYDLDKNVVIAAYAKDGYEIENNVEDQFEVFSDGSTDEKKTVVPAQVTFDKEKGTYTIPTTAGVEYQIDGKTVKAGVYELEKGKSVVVSAVALEGYTIKSGSVTKWTFTHNGTGSTSSDTSSSTSGTGSTSSDTSSSTSSTSSDEHKSPEGLVGTNYIGYYQDSNGKWHKPNGEFASSSEVTEIEAILDKYDSSSSTSSTTSTTSSSTSGTSSTTSSSTSGTSSTTSGTSSTTGSSTVNATTTGNTSGKQAYAQTGVKTLGAFLAGIPLIGAAYFIIKKKF